VADPARRDTRIFRLIGLLASVAGVTYIVWRWGWTLNPAALWFAIPLAVAETYSVIDALLFVLMMWKPVRREPPPPIEGATVDVFVTTYNEPLEVVRPTLEAAVHIDWPELRVHLLDDGARPTMRALAAALGCGYHTRGEEWRGKPLHAKAGNVANALQATSGEFILILDADMIPRARFVRRCLGYFRDPRVAFVQTPQRFYNVPPRDPFGSDAPLFYGPILRGKDGWNAAFFCGSNAILRREALMALGVADYVRAVQRGFSSALRALGRLLRRRGAAAPDRRALRVAMRWARHAVRAGEPLERATAELRAALSETVQRSTEADLAAVASDLAALAGSGDAAAAEAGRFLLQSSTELSRRLPSDTFGLRDGPGAGLDLTRSHEALPVLPLATISVTEDMATAMRLHAMGWRSVFHEEDLAWGLAPEDLGATLGQRLRWAQGTIQVMIRENPLFVRGLSLGQRFQYLTTMYSYFSGFASLIYLAWPVVFLLSGVYPVRAWSLEFFARLVPYLLLNRFMFWWVARGLSVRRGEDYSLALFPVWIRAVLGVLFGVRLRFVVTPKSRQTGRFYHLIVPQIATIAVTVVAIAWAAVSMLAFHRGPGLVALLVNVFWAAYNVRALLVIVQAAGWTPPPGWNPQPPVDDSAGLPY
jgi:cellulose synthase (UDP-forming)